jgi:hypothetical protein
MKNLNKNISKKLETGFSHKLQNQLYNRFDIQTKDVFISHFDITFFQQIYRNLDRQSYWLLKKKLK